MKDLPDILLSQGRFSITTDEAATMVGWTRDATAVGLSRLARRGALFSPARGLYIVIPPSYRNWGTIPGAWLIDPLMTHLGRRYYVALLSAAALHGASHQAPQVFQVMASRYTSNRDAGRVRLRFFTRSDIDSVPTQKVNVETGYAVVSTREATIFDLVARPHESGGLSNVATIVSDMTEHLDANALMEIAKRSPRAVVRRTGWLFETFASDFAAIEELREIATPEEGAPDALDPSRGAKGQIERRWGLRINTAVEADL